MGEIHVRGPLRPLTKPERIIRSPPYPALTMPTRGSPKAARLLRLVAQLEAGPRTAADLAGHLGVSQRTLQRDLEELPEIGNAVERDGRRYRLRAGSTTLDPVEALAVHATGLGGEVFPVSDAAQVSCIWAAHPTIRDRYNSQARVASMTPMKERDYR